MSRIVPIAGLLTAILTGCVTAPESAVEAPETVVVCPDTPPPLSSCEGWEMRPDSAFRLNTELRDDRLHGQEVYGACLVLLRAYDAAWRACKRP